LSRLHTEPSLDKEQRSHSPILEQKQREPGAAASLPVSVHKGQTGAGPPSFIKIFLLFSPARSKAPSSPQKEEAVVPPLLSKTENPLFPLSCRSNTQPDRDPALSLSLYKPPGRQQEA
jgi:hypothetical protein